MEQVHAKVVAHYDSTDSFAANQAAWNTWMPGLISTLFLTYKHTLGIANLRALKGKAKLTSMRGTRNRFEIYPKVVIECSTPTASEMEKVAVTIESEMDAMSRISTSGYLEYHRHFASGSEDEIKRTPNNPKLKSKMT